MRPARRIHRSRSVQNLQNNQQLSPPSRSTPPQLDMQKVRSILKNPVGKSRTIFGRSKSVSGIRVTFDLPATTNDNNIHTNQQDNQLLIDFSDNNKEHLQPNQNSNAGKKVSMGTNLLQPTTIKQTDKQTRKIPTDNGQEIVCFDPLRNPATSDDTVVGDWNDFVKQYVTGDTAGHAASKKSDQTENQAKVGSSTSVQGKLIF